jgi:hypothetical protein
MDFKCLITKGIDAHSEYVILIAFPRQQWLRERATVLRLYIHCLSSGAGPGFVGPEACTILGGLFKKNNTKLQIQKLGTKVNTYLVPLPGPWKEH